MYLIVIIKIELTPMKFSSRELVAGYASVRMRKRGIRTYVRLYCLYICIPRLLQLASTHEVQVQRLLVV